METLADRIAWVLQEKRVPTASAWSEQAGLARTYLATFLSRARQGTPSDMGVQVLAALAKAAGVSFTWLALGIGSADDVADALPPNLKAALERLPGNAFPQALIRQGLFVREVIGEADLPADVWVDYLEGLRREARRVGLEIAAARLDRRGVPR